MQDKHALWKWLIIIIATVFSVFLVTPPTKKIPLGLDLKGGASFTVKIDEEVLLTETRSRMVAASETEVKAEVDRVMRGAQDRALEVLRNRVDNLGISEPVIYPGKDNRIFIQLPGIDEEKRAQAEQSIRSVAFLEFRLVHEKNDDLTEQVFDKSQAPEGYRILRLGNETFYVDDPAFPAASRDAAWHERVSRFSIPDAGYEFMLEKDDKDGQPVYRPRFVKRRYELSGDSLKAAAVDYKAMGQPVVRIEFDARGAKKFANVTADYAPGGPRNPNPNQFRQLAIVLDQKLYSAPVIREPIYGGRAEISGSFSLPQATLLANILSAGSLPAPVKIVEKRVVAPGLGQDSIRSGINAAVVGSVGVVLFMALYYLLAGVVADIALLLNVILLPIGLIATAGFMGIFVKEGGGGGPISLPVLTLPGIAGILLTIGMAVDANVLIYERIREELRTGKKLWSAISAGYDRAFITILDSNLTTLITAVILFIVGSGPIRGFAVTLSAGILVSMFTALVVTKLVFDLMVSRFGLQNLKMLSFIKVTNIDFIGKRRIAIAISIGVIVVSWAVLIAKGVSDPTKIFGVDFTGGSSVTYTFAQKIPVAEAREAIEASGARDAQIQYQKEMDGDREYLQVKTSGDVIGDRPAAEVVTATLKAKFPESGLVVSQEDTVGGQVGSELTQRSIWALGLSLLGMIIYLAWRFELGFAIGATVALFHDVLVTAGVYVLMGQQMNMPIVAALLTIVGFSVNDTIVIFDRIREDLRLNKQMSFVDICNLSINQTLSRTILTSFTVFITVAAMLVLGGGGIYDFALAMFIGILTGTYSTVYIATPVVLAWHRGRKPDISSGQVK